MTNCGRDLIRCFLVTIALSALSGCQPALIYAERTSLNFGAVQVNDNVAEPVKINVGIVRSVATMAPPRSGDTEQQVEVTNADKSTSTVPSGRGDAVSVFSNFRLEYDKPKEGATASLPLVTEDLDIQTRFASGLAAIQISDRNDVVTAMVTARTVVPDPPSLAALKKRLIGCVNAMQDRAQIEAVAQSLGATVSSSNQNATQRNATRAIDKADEPALKKAISNGPLGKCP